MATNPAPRHGSTYRLVGFSAERTLLLVASAEHGEPRLLKVFESGSPADAERELHAARALAGPGTVPAHDVVTLDGRPALELDWVPGQDLAAQIARHGPLDSDRAARLALDLAQILARIANIGWIHGDVKPANVLLADDGSTVLLDLEHASRQVSTGGHAPRAFTGGSIGYAPPEAFCGAAADVSFDVFGFGCTLLHALTGHREPANATRARTRALATLEPALEELCQACLGSPDQRPVWDRVIASLESHATARRSPAETALEHARLAIAARELERARTLLDAVDPQPAQSERIDALRRALVRAQRLSARVRAADLEPGEHHSLATIAIRARAAASTIARFPADTDALQTAHELRFAIARALPDAPALAKRRARDGDFGGAERLLEHAHAALAATRRLGGIAVAAPESPNVPPVLREPNRFLELAARDVRAERARPEEFNERVAHAEAALDAESARVAVDAAIETYGGASEISAGLKERLHRFEFALSRISGASQALQECVRQLELARAAVDLTPTLDVVARAEARTGEPRASHCRALLRALEDLQAELPEVDDRIPAAITALRRALETLTDAAWTTLARDEALLDATPIPIRPLQADLNRVDRLDLSGCLIDLPSRSRTDLLDALETVRVRVERARSTRDRLARGAEEALEQGHLTTALYDLERVASRFDSDTSRTADIPISGRYQQAKRLKQEIEEAARANHELAARHRSLTTDPNAHAEARIDVLRERQRQLEFLTQNVGEHRRAGYAADLATVQFALFEEIAAAGATRYRACDPARRAHVAEQLIGELGLLVPKSGWDSARQEQAERTIAHWQQLAEASPVRRSAWRRRTIAIASAVLVAVAGTVGWSAFAADRSLAQLAAELEPSLLQDREHTTSQLRKFVEILERRSNDAPEAAVAARALVTLVDAHVLDAEWLARLRGSLDGLESSLDRAPDPDSIVAFGRVAHSVALRSARGTLPTELLREHLDLTARSRLAVPEAAQPLVR